MQILKTVRDEKTFYYTGNAEVIATVKPALGGFWQVFRYDGQPDHQYATRTAAEQSVETGKEVLS